MITFRGSARPDEKWSRPLFTISVSALPEFLFRGQNCVHVCARARVYAGTSVHLKDAPRCFLSASFSPNRPEVSLDQTSSAGTSGTGDEGSGRVLGGEGEAAAEAGE